MKNFEFKTLVGRNSTTLSASATQQDITLGAHSYMTINVSSALLGDSFERGVFKAYVGSKIDSYSAKIGYPAAIDYTDVEEYFVISAHLFALLRSIIRRGNAINVRNNQGLLVGHLLSQRYPTLTFQGALAALPNVINPIDDSAIFKLSNSDWASLIGEATASVIMPATWLPIIQYFMDGFFTNDVNSSEGFSDVFSFIPVSKTNSDYGADLKAQIKAYVNQLNQLLTVSPFLLSFMTNEFVSLTNIENIDFTRDLAKQTVNLIVDNDLAATLNNNISVMVPSGLNVGYSPNIAEYNYYRNAEFNMSMIDYSMLTNITADQIPYAMLLDTKNEARVAYRNLIITELKSDGTLITSVCLPTGIIEVSITGDQVFPVSMNHLSKSMSRFEFYPPYGYIYAYDPVNLEWGLYITLKENVNLFMINEDDFKEAQDDYRLSLAFGTEFYMNTPVNPYAGIGSVGTDEKVGSRERTRNRKTK